MASEYWVAWIVLYVFGIGLITLFVYPLRKHFYLAFLVGGMGVYWMLVPIPFDEQHWAPLFVVLIFQVFFDPDVSFAFSATVALIGSTTIIAATLALYAFNSAFRHVAVFARRVMRPGIDITGAKNESKARDDLEATITRV